MDRPKRRKASGAEAVALAQRPASIIEALAKSAPAPAPAPQPCPADAPDRCSQPKWAPQPEAVVSFRQPILLSEIGVLLGSAIEGQRELRLGCHPFAASGVRVHLTIDVLFEQRWHFQELMLASLSNTLALAPHETLKITLRNTQRKYLDQLNVEQVEQSQQTESTIVDKDVLNVVRSSSKTANWSVSANGSISVGAFSAGASASFSQSLSKSTAVTSEKVRENTVKSSENLKLMQKTEVREITETTQESTSARTLVNPYRDRSVSYNIFNLAKHYCVEFHSVGLRPALIINVLKLVFDRHFVLTNGAFLDEALLDPGLRFELAQALEAVINAEPPEAIERTRERALMALHYLFAEPNIFHLPIPNTPFSQPLPDPNLSENSFVYFEGNGLRDAVSNKLGTVFTTLGVFYDIYVKRIVPTPDAELALEVAVGLAGALSPAWAVVEESDERGHVLDTSQYTEIFRRLGGFLTIVSGMIEPALKPAEEERESAKAASRAEFVIGRVVDHLNCYAELYTRRFLEFIAAQSRMEAIFLFIRDLIENHLQLAPNVKQSLVELLDIEASFIDRSTIVVPGRQDLNPAAVPDLGGDEGVNTGGGRVKLGLLNSFEAITPTDGMHVEPVPGTCILPDVPAPPSIRPTEDG